MVISLYISIYLYISLYISIYLYVVISIDRMMVYVWHILDMFGLWSMIYPYTWLIWLIYGLDIHGYISIYLYMVIPIDKMIQLWLRDGWIMINELMAWTFHGPFLWFIYGLYTYDMDKSWFLMGKLSPFLWKSISKSI